MMNNQEFTELVREMRQAQKDYFRTRSREALEKSKQLEKAVDAVLAQSKQLTFL